MLSGEMLKNPEEIGDPGAEASGIGVFRAEELVLLARHVTLRAITIITKIRAQIEYNIVKFVISGKNDRRTFHRRRKDKIERITNQIEVKEAERKENQKNRSRFLPRSSDTML